MKPPIDRFTVDLSHVGEAKDEIESRMKDIGGQIQKLIERMVIDDSPILIPILNITKKRSQLEKLARALNRVAPLVDEYDKLHKRLHVIEVAQEEPGWFASCLGDFSSDMSSVFDKKIDDWEIPQEKDDEGGDR